MIYHIHYIVPRLPEIHIIETIVGTQKNALLCRSSILSVAAVDADAAPNARVTYSLAADFTAGQSV